MVDDVAERVRRALGAEYRLWWGQIAKIEVRIGRPSGYLSRVVSGEITPFRRDLTKILAALGVENTDRWMRRRVSPALDLGAILTNLPHPAHRTFPLRELGRALRRALPGHSGEAQYVDAAKAEIPPDLESLSRRELTHCLAQCRSVPLARRTLAWLDLLRYDDPRLAATLARKLTLACGHLEDNALELTLKAGVVWASALRFAGDLINSGSILRELSPYSWKLGRAVEADLLQRLAPLLRDHLQIPNALAVVDEAQALYLRDGNTVGCAKTYLDRALCLYTANQPESAVRMARAAIELLPEAEKRHRSAAFLVIGLASGQEQYVDRAEQLLSPAYNYDRLSIAYGRAQLARTPGEKESYVREARRLAMRTNSFDAALTTLLLVGLLAERGRLDEAAKVVREAYYLLGPLRAHPTACMALVELGRLGERITADAVLKAQKAIRNARVSLPNLPDAPSH
jgi:tetratricopeptide (TPR) repeat protein